MNATPRNVAVVVCARNAASTIGAALASADAAILQAGAEAERLVVVGDSADATEAVAVAHGWPVHRQMSTGLSGARNEALAATTAPWVAFLDADDRWPDDSLDQRLTALEASAATALVVGHLQRCDPTGVPIDQPRPGWTPGAVLFARSVAGAVGPWDESFTAGADSEWLRRAASQPTVTLDDVVLWKTMRPDSMSATSVVAYRREPLRIARQHVEDRRG